MPEDGVRLVRTMTPQNIDGGNLVQLGADGIRHVVTRKLHLLRLHVLRARVWHGLHTDKG